MAVSVSSLAERRLSLSLSLSVTLLGWGAEGTLSFTCTPLDSSMPYRLWLKAVCLYPYGVPTSVCRMGGPNTLVFPHRTFARGKHAICLRR